MEVHCLPSGITVLAPAKLNLYFEVLAKRPDGFHEIESLMVPVDLYDVLKFRPTAELSLRVDCRWAADCLRSGHAVTCDPLPSERDNLAWRALNLLRQRAGVSGGATIELVKRIPAAAGLGGGSSDAAAALVAGNLGWNVNWPTERLAELAAELGSDVPFFLHRGAAVCRGRGERIERVGKLAGLHFIVLRPGDGLSTAQVYARCRPAAAQDVVVIGPLVAALQRGDLRQARRWFVNRLEPAAQQLSPWPARLRSEFGHLGCVAQQMSGSGSSYFGVCRHARQARRLSARLAARRLGRVFSVRS